MQRLLFILPLLIFACNERSVDPKKNYGVASASRYASEAGYNILDKGGNAFDAAIAVASVLNVTEPMMSGLGGYGTILIYDAKKKEVRFLNCSGRFPLLSNSDLMREPTPGYMENRRGPKSISTPGNLNAWHLMHTEYGEKDWSELFEYAIKHAREGIVLTETA